MEKDLQLYPSVMLGNVNDCPATDVVVIPLGIFNC
jgi:hypothetical protein